MNKDFLLSQLEQRKAQHALRELKLSPPHMVDLCSNDYLGLARNASMQEAVHALLIERQLMNRPDSLVMDYPQDNASLLWLIRDSSMHFIDDIHTTLDLLKFGCQMLTDINNNIVAFQQEGIDVVLSDIELKSWLEPLVKAYKFVARPKGIEIGLSIDKDVPGIINSDKLKLSQVLINLLLNAIKFSSAGNPISVTVYGNKRRLYITVADQGMGIPDDKLKDIFLPYVRLNTGVPGIGLGLDICKRFINALGGQITVDSTVGKGTVFTIILPLVAQQEEAILHRSNDSNINLAHKE